jgi:hypothetical protein
MIVCGVVEKKTRGGKKRREKKNVEKSEHSGK